MIYSVRFDQQVQELDQTNPAFEQPLFTVRVQHWTIKNGDDGLTDRQTNNKQNLAKNVFH